MPDDYYVSQYSGEEIDERLTAAHNAVRYDAAQTLTDAQKTQARANIAAAPDGFGLGGAIVYAPENSDGVSDANLIDATGFYLAFANAGGSGWNYVFHMQYPSSAALQFSSYVNDTTYRIRKKIFGVWQPWEWVNPPLALGVEYRTTELYLGKPVYAKTIDCGTVPLNTQKTVSMGVSGQLNKIRCNAWATSSSDAFTIPRKISGTEVTATAASSANNIYISSNTDTLANYTIYATVYYTKATD